MNLSLSFFPLNLLPSLLQVFFFLLVINVISRDHVEDEMENTQKQKRG